MGVEKKDFTIGGNYECGDNFSNEILCFVKDQHSPKISQIKVRFAF